MCSDTRIEDDIMTFIEENDIEWKALSATLLHCERSQEYAIIEALKHCNQQRRRFMAGEEMEQKAESAGAVELKDGLPKDMEVTPIVIISMTKTGQIVVQGPLAKKQMVLNILGDVIKIVANHKEEVSPIIQPNKV